MNEYEPSVAIAHASHLQMGVLASKQLFTDNTASNELVNHLLDREVEKSGLQLAVLKGQLTTDFQIRQNFLLSCENERLKVLSKKDPLTGLDNRNGAESTYEGLRSRHLPDRRSDSSVKPIDSQVMFIDVDNFKLINDTHGHPAGDQLLVKIAEIITANTRPKDIKARWGGDEFIILMPGASRQRVSEVAEAIRQELGDFGDIDPRLNTTLSIGIGRADYDLSLEETVHLADRALLHAKRHGKNKDIYFDDIATGA